MIYGFWYDMVSIETPCGSHIEFRNDLELWEAAQEFGGGN
jgi:hypothetical protein